MGNTLLTPQIIANEALMVLESNLTMANLVHRDYSNEFVKVGDKVPVKVIEIDEQGRINLTMKDLVENKEETTENEEAENDNIDNE